jgi:hypothetical protein
VGVAGVLLIGGGEIVARVSSVGPREAVPNPNPWAQEHPVLGWANRVGSIPSREKGHALMTFWADGRRASRPDPGIAEDQLKVVLVGGSFTQGYGVRDEQTFAWMLDEAFPDLALENYGSGGYGTYQSLLVLEQLLPTQAIPPGLVIYGFMSHHADRNVQTHAWLEALQDIAGQRFASPYVELRDGILDRHPPASIRNWPLERNSALVHAWHAGWHRWALQDRDAQRVPATIALLLEMNELVRRSGSRLLVAILHEVRHPRIFESRSLARRVDIVNCSHPKGLFRSPELRVGGTGHPNEKLHAHWAGCIGVWLEAHPPGRGWRARVP